MRNPLMLLTNRVPTPYVGEGERRSWTWNLGRGGGQLRQIEAMGANGTLFSIVNRLSTSTSAVNWHMHRERVRASVVCSCCGEKGVELVTKHPALSVWNKPNDFFTRQELVESVQQHVELTGEGWTVIARTGNVPYELWPVRPDRMEPVTSPTEYLLGYIYRSPSGEEVPLAREDVLFQRMPNPADPYRGLGAVQSIMSTLEGVRFASEWNRNFFVNGARPGGIVQVARQMQDREWRKFQERWAEMHQGVSNAGRVAILESDAKWVDLKITQKDMDFVAQAKLDKETIREAFGIPKFAIGDVDDVNRATADASAAWYAKEMTVPRLDRWKGLLNNDFLPQFPGYDPALSFVYTSPVPADREADREDLTAKSAVYKTLVDAGVAPEDAALVAGLPPMRVVSAPAQPAPNTEFAALLKGALA